MQYLATPRGSAISGGNARRPHFSSALALIIAIYAAGQGTRRDNSGQLGTWLPSLIKTGLVLSLC